MTARTLLCWSGLTAIVAGVLEALFAVLDFLLFPPSQPFIQPSSLSFSQQAATNTWVIEQVVNWVAKVFLLWALVGLYSRQAKETGVLGFIAFLLSFVGITLVFGTIWGYFLLAPGFAKVAPAFLDAGGTQFSLLPGLVGLILPFALALLGFLLFGVASLRAKVFPRWAAVLFILFPPLFVVKGFIPLPSIADIAFGAGLVWMGYTLWAEQRGLARQRAVAAVS
ncbi:MAG TPA: hypothetical protein VH599_04970 [Ktedonobacterales bacterium]|jgi:hypothetical protein